MRQAGDVVRVDIFQDDKGRSKGCGVVEFRSKQDSARALKELDQSELNGRKLFLKIVRLLSLMFRIPICTPCPASTLADLTSPTANGNNPSPEKRLSESVSSIHHSSPTGDGVKICRGADAAEAEARCKPALFTTVNFRRSKGTRKNSRANGETTVRRW